MSLLSRFLNRAPASKSPAGATGPGGGKSTGQLVRDSNRWRDNYNPLRNLVISRVVSMIESAERGDFAELQLTMRKIERRYPVMKGLKARILAALEKLDWEIKVPEDMAEDAAAKAQQEFLRSRYDLIENLTDAIGFLATADFRGYAILQKHRHEEGQNDGAVKELHWLPQDQFCRNGSFGDFYYNVDSRFGVAGDGCAASLGEKNRIGSAELPRDEFVIRETDAPLYEIALIAFVNWGMGRKDYSAFVEIFGLPNGVAIMPPNIPAGQEADYRAAAEKVADGVSGALPNGSDIKFPTASVRGDAPFKTFCDAQDADVVLAGTGGRLAMLTADKGGLGDGPATEHADAFDDIAQAVARRINQTLQRDFDKVELAAQFPGQPCLAYFELCAVEQEDATEVITQIAGLKSAGYKVSTEQVEEKTGYQLEEAIAPDLNLNPDPDSNLNPPDQTDEEEAIQNRERLLNYDPNQERDGEGQWADTFGDFTPLLTYGMKVDASTLRDVGGGYKVGIIRPEIKPPSSRRTETTRQTGSVLVKDDGEIIGAFVGDTVSIRESHRGKGLSKFLYEERVKLGPLADRTNFSRAGKAARESFLKVSNRESQQPSFASTIAAKIDPVASLLNRITEMKDDAQMMATLQHFLTNADALAAIVTADVRRQQSALEQTIAPALAKGLHGRHVINRRILNYDPDQPRDERGQWSEAGNVDFKTTKGRQIFEFAQKNNLPIVKGGGGFKEHIAAAGGDERKAQAIGSLSHAAYFAEEAGEQQSGLSSKLARTNFARGKAEVTTLAGKPTEGLRLLDKTLKTPFGSRYYQADHKGDWFDIRIADHANRASGRDSSFDQLRGKTLTTSGMDSPHRLNILVNEPVKTEAEAKRAIKLALENLPEKSRQRIGNSGRETFVDIRGTKPEFEVEDD